MMVAKPIAVAMLVIVSMLMYSAMLYISMDLMKLVVSVMRVVMLIGG